MLTGNNGILTQAKNAKENTAEAEKKETQDLNKINSYIKEQTIKNNYTDTKGDKATIPEGFSVDETENVISKGLVVHGPDKLNGDNGSEFVWVPVSDINSMAQCSTAGGDCNLQLEDGVLKCKTHNDNEKIVGKLYAINIGENFGTVNTTYDANSGYREPAILTEYDNNSNYNDNLFSLESLENDYKEMATSVAKYGGFYVGRYETSLTSATESLEGTEGKVQSKSGIIPKSASEGITSMWYGLYKAHNKTYTGENNSVQSSMIWGSQYDAMLNWAESGTDKDKIRNTALGNHSGSIKTTGNKAYSEDSINNIRDLGGNLREWTLESYGTNHRVSRGGGYGVNISPSYRSNRGGPNEASSLGCSRLALYISI